MTLSK